MRSFPTPQAAQREALAIQLEEKAAVAAAEAARKAAENEAFQRALEKADAKAAAKERAAAERTRRTNDEGMELVRWCSCSLLSYFFCFVCWLVA